MGSPARQLTPEERQLVQGIVNDTYEVFLKSVAEGRKIPVEKIRPIADGRVVTGTQAVKLKLVDKIGGLSDTLRQAARTAGLGSKYKVVEYGRKSWIDRILEMDTESSVQRAVAEKILEGLTKQTESQQGLR